MATRVEQAASAADLGPTLTANPKIVPVPQPVCTTCPAASWYIEDAKPHCFCAAYRAEMYGGRHGTVSACDAREAAIKARDRELRRDTD